MRKTGPGRPSKFEEDLPKLIHMASIWWRDGYGRSARYLSRIAVGLESISVEPRVPAKRAHRPQDAKSNTSDESHAKRLERRFSAYLRVGWVKAVAAYCELEEQRHVALKQMGVSTLGPFSSSRLESEGFVAANDLALERMARSFDASNSDAKALSDKGLKILKKCRPQDYPQWRV